MAFSQKRPTIASKSGISSFDNMPVVLVEKESPQISVVTLNRPERRNALTLELLTELCAAINVASEQPEQRVLIFRGERRGVLHRLGFEGSRRNTKAHATAEMVANTLIAISQTRLVTLRQCTAPRLPVAQG